MSKITHITYTEEQVTAKRMKLPALRLIGGVLAALLLGGLIFLCAGVTTANALKRQLAATVLLVAGGWLLIAYYYHILRPGTQRLMKRKGFFDRLPSYALWTVFGALLATGLFLALTDTSRDKKVTVYLDVPAVEERGLAAALEEELPEGIRLVKTRSFSYAMMNGTELKNGDIWIVPVSKIEIYREDLGTPDLIAEGKLPGFQYYKAGDGLIGVLFYDPAAGIIPASEWIWYQTEDEEPEAYIAFFNPDSPHTKEENGAAYEIFRRLLSLP